MLEADLVRLILGLLFLACLLAVLYLRQRQAARLIMAIGALHVLGAAWVGRAPLARIFAEGFFGEADSSLGRIPSHVDRELIFWSLLWGGFTFLLGQFISWAAREGKRPPAYFGWELAAISLVAASLTPKDGFWLLLLPAYLLIRGAGRAADEKSS
ncbi:MAG TPA: DUF6463 family protein [Pyrinomonadaceae bacterium]|jgi:hypothetical protein